MVVDLVADAAGAGQDIDVWSGPITAGIKLATVHYGEVSPPLQPMGNTNDLGKDVGGTTVYSYGLSIVPAGTTPADAGSSQNEFAYQGDQLYVMVTAPSDVPGATTYGTKVFFTAAGAQRPPEDAVNLVLAGVDAPANDRLVLLDAVRRAQPDRRSGRCCLRHGCSGWRLRTRDWTGRPTSGQHTDSPRPNRPRLRRLLRLRVPSLGGIGRRGRLEHRVRLATDRCDRPVGRWVVDRSPSCTVHRSRRAHSCCRDDRPHDILTISISGGLAEHSVELAATMDAELQKHALEMCFNRANRDIQIRRDGTARQAGAHQASDLELSSGEWQRVRHRIRGGCSGVLARVQPPRRPRRGGVGRDDVTGGDDGP